MTLRLNVSGSCTRPDAVETEPYTYATPGQLAYKQTPLYLYARHARPSCGALVLPQAETGAAAYKQSPSAARALTQPRCRGYHANMGTIRILRVYEEPEPGEYRVLVDRLWPRGIKKDTIDLWLKEAAPSTEVRNAFGHVAEHFETFERDYTAELHGNPAVTGLRELIREHEHVVLLYGAKDHQQNQAAVLLRFLNATS